MSREIDALVAIHVVGFTWRKNLVKRMDWGKTGHWDIGLKFLVPPNMGDDDGYGGPLWGHDIGSSTESPLSLCYVPAYSTDIAAAWQAVEKMRKLSIGNYLYDFVLTAEGSLSVPYYTAAFNVLGDAQHGGTGVVEYFDAEAGTAPMAICLAALKAVGIEVDTKL